MKIDAGKKVTYQFEAFWMRSKLLAEWSDSFGKDAREDQKTDEGCLVVIYRAAEANWLAEPASLRSAVIIRSQRTRRICEKGY